jgi:peptidoglycan/xylan/chitin deacetylase (PgdA/CDA1 family)
MPTSRLITIFINTFQPERNWKGGLKFPYIKKRRSRNVQILIYHRVNDDRDPFFPAVSTHVFAKQMDYLASYFNVLSLDEIVDMIKRRDVPDNAAVITFDDGYRDNYINAFPVLNRLSLPFTVFLATDAIGSGRTLWHDRVFSAFRETRLAFIKGFGNDSREYPLRTQEEKLFVQREILKFLRSLNDYERSVWIDHIINHLQVVDRKENSELMLTWDEIKMMHENHVSFGSHTITHPILSKVSIEKVRLEVHESKKIIEKNIGVQVKAFAYPNGKEGDFDESTKAILIDEGYVCALTTIFGTNEIVQDLFELRRWTPWGEDVHTFSSRLNYYKFSS